MEINFIYAYITPLTLPGPSLKQLFKSTKEKPDPKLISPRRPYKR